MKNQSNQIRARWAITALLLLVGSTGVTTRGWARCYDCMYAGGGCYSCIGRGAGVGDWTNCTSSCGSGGCIVSAPCHHTLSAEISRDGSISSASIRVMGQRADGRVGMFSAMSRIFEKRYIVSEQGEIRNCIGNFTQRFFSAVESRRVRRETSRLVV